jgi:ubiquinone/menaquinone biosynthesis C-methylase UbiE
MPDLSRLPLQEKMSPFSYRMMTLLFDLIDLFSSRVRMRANDFGLEPGLTVVDYGCGPGRYAFHFSHIVGETGRVYAVDIHELALADVEKKIRRYKLHNVHTALATGYTTGLPPAIADRVFALDMFHGVRQPDLLLAEFRRLCKPAGLLVIDDGHQPRQLTRQKILASGLWRIEKDMPDHLECRPA